jgi:uncharacterized protein (TIGR00251 family)
LQQTDRGTLLKVKVIPKAARNEMVGWEKDALKIRIAGAPQKGEVNAKLIQFLADFFCLGKTKIILTQGHTSRYKTVCFIAAELSFIENKLMSLASSNYRI